MNSPAVALTWEIWCRHRKRLLMVLFVILGFALFYSKLCAFIGFDLDNADALDFLAEKIAPMHGARTEFFQVLASMFFICAPLASMVITLFYVVWIFTFTDLNLRDPLSFPKRFFTLPISTSFLASRLIASGMAAVFLVYLAWTRLVHLPHINVFDGFNDGLTWITLLILSQAIVWSLDAFPFTRVLLLIVVVFLLFIHPDYQWCRWLEAHQTPVQLSLLLIGCGLAFVGLGKIRHGSWQRWFWDGRIPLASARKNLRGPKSFRSAAQAQFWFEWRRHGRKVFYIVCALTVVPFLVVVPELILHQGSASGDPTCGLCLYLLAVPLFIHFFQGVSYERKMPQFTANHPLNNGEIIVAQWKAMALSTVLSWGVTLLLIGGVTLVGDLTVINSTLHSLPEYRHLIRPLIPVILLGLIICTVVLRSGLGLGGSNDGNLDSSGLRNNHLERDKFWLRMAVCRHSSKHGFSANIFSVSPRLAIFLGRIEVPLGTMGVPRGVQKAAHRTTHAGPVPLYLGLARWRRSGTSHNHMPSRKRDDLALSGHHSDAPTRKNRLCAPRIGPWSPSLSWFSIV